MLTNPYKRLSGFVSVAGLMNVNNYSVLPYRGILTSDMEKSVSLESGIYSQPENPMTSTEGQSLYHGVLVCNNSKTNNGYFGVQYYYFGDGTKKYTRVIEYSTLGKWVSIDQFGYNSLEEMANALKPLLGLS